MLLCCLMAMAREYGDSAVYQGMSIKVDIGTPIIEAARSGGKVQDYEMAMNWRLKDRWYPTVEGGYAKSQCTTDGGMHVGQGGFCRIGVDISALKKGKGINCLMIGVRMAGACQDYALSQVKMNTTYWIIEPQDLPSRIGLDAWGEIVAGCQVQIGKFFQMGWYLRSKILITRTPAEGQWQSYYIPGFGFRQDSNWGFNYYLGFKF